MFRPGDIVALKEPDIGEEAVAICRDATMRRTLYDSFKTIVLKHNVSQRHTEYDSFKPHGKHRCF